MPKQSKQLKPVPDIVPVNAGTPLWELGIAELAGHNLETAGRSEVNDMLAAGWLLLHIYTLKYREDGIWRERPMAILGKPKTTGQTKRPSKKPAAQATRMQTSPVAG